MRLIQLLAIVGASLQLNIQVWGQSHLQRNPDLVPSSETNSIHRHSATSTGQPKPILPDEKEKNIYIRFHQSYYNPPNCDSKEDGSTGLKSQKGEDGKQGCQTTIVQDPQQEQYERLADYIEDISDNSTIIDDYSQLVDDNHSGIYDVAPGPQQHDDDHDPTEENDSAYSTNPIKGPQIAPSIDEDGGAGLQDPNRSPNSPLFISTERDSDQPSQNNRSPNTNSNNMKLNEQKNEIVSKGQPTLAGIIAGILCFGLLMQLSYFCYSRVCGGKPAVVRNIGRCFKRSSNNSVQSDIEGKCQVALETMSI